jgi:hypothetical protein
MISRLLITGATGFVGKSVCEQAVRHGLAVKGALRIHGEGPSCIEPFVVGEINVATDWGSALRDVKSSFTWPPASTSCIFQRLQVRYRY